MAQYVKTWDEHYDFLMQMIQLKLWFVAKWKYENPKESLSDIINNRTLIKNYTDFNTGALNDDISHSEPSGSWNELVCELVDLYKSIKPKGDYDLFENSSKSLIKPHMNKRIERDLEIFNNIYISEKSRSNSPFFFSREPDTSEEAKYLSAKVGNGKAFIRVHQWNNRYPESYLTDPKKFKEDIFDIVEKIREFGGVGLYGTGWMNLFPIFTRLMPPEYKNNMLGPFYDIKGNLGYWGQFITPNYTFQHKMGNRYRKTKIIPFANTLCFAFLEDFERFFNKAI